MFCYYDNGQSMRAVDGNYQPTTGEVLFADYATEGQILSAFPDFSATQKQNALQVLLDEYNADVQQLKERITAGMLTGGTAQTARVTAAQNEFATRKAKYATDRAAIINS